MPLTPQITLTATLLDYSGNQQGSATQPAWLRIALCGFGPILPAIPGTGNVAKVSSWFVDIPYTGSQITVKLWGNDVIAPLNQTYYAISVLDTQKNVIQTGNYQFSGTETVDLSGATQIVVPGYNQPTGYIIINPAAGAFVVNPNGWNGPVVIDMTLTANVTPTLTGFQRGQLVQFLIRQNGTGGWNVTWPANVPNPPAVDPTANSVTTANFFVDQFGKFYPAVGWS